MGSKEAMTRAPVEIGIYTPAIPGVQRFIASLLPIHWVPLSRKPGVSFFPAPGVKIADDGLHAVREGDGHWMSTSRLLLADRLEKFRRDVGLTSPCYIVLQSIPFQNIEER